MICILFFCAGNLYFSNKRIKFIIVLDSVWELMINLGDAETDANWRSIPAFILRYLIQRWAPANRPDYPKICTSFGVNRPGWGMFTGVGHSSFPKLTSYFLCLTGRSRIFGDSRTDWWRLPTTPAPMYLRNRFITGKQGGQTSFWTCLLCLQCSSLWLGQKTLNELFKVALDFCVKELKGR